jgi:hypothetical protein
MSWRSFSDKVATFRAHQLGHRRPYNGKSMTDITQTDTKKWEDLRKPFPKEAIGTIPKGGMKLDYVGHAAVTDRLNSVVGPENWELVPLASNADGTPVILTRDKKSVMWAHLTVNGATKLCVGTADTSKEELEKELIGDALRNGAMRFGVALDLWSKDELESQIGSPEKKNHKPSAAATKPEPATDVQMSAIQGLLHQLLPGDENQGKRQKIRAQAITKTKASELIKELQAKVDAQPIPVEKATS